MAYVEGNASNQNEVLQGIKDFAIDLGWVIDEHDLETPGHRLSLHKGSNYIHIKAFILEELLYPFEPSVGSSVNNNAQAIGISGSDGYNSELDWNKQPGYPRTIYSNSNNGMFAVIEAIPGPYRKYFLFSPNPDCIYVELEARSGVYFRMGFGKLDLFNPDAAGDGRFFYATTSFPEQLSTFTNGIDNPTAFEMVPFRGAQYGAAGRYSGSYLRCAFESFNGWTQSVRTNGDSRSDQACQGGSTHDFYLAAYSVSPLNEVALLTPNIVAVNRADNFLSPVGVVPGQRYLRMGHYQSSEEFQLGPDTWKVYPWFQKDGFSGNRAIAYLKVDD
jgi:hypothetical protein